ncbi:hypothetical protein [Roseiconus lacunae]|uniref:hypothetical protein n=1 Tax=Roseiconus lacunae TaxID=2605694 RepID=UPI001E30FC90|nr:hypothetical protein [Roseiconus lacunae]MCD0458627.1 hypothetical protein [Roseiconus lacunae]
MLSRSETETIRAALSYWRDEIAGHDDLARRYLGTLDVEPLARKQFEPLIQSFLWSKLRYIAVDEETGQLAPRLLSELELHNGAGGPQILTVVVR